MNQPVLEKHIVEISAGDIGLVIKCDRKKYFVSHFEDLIRILDDLIISAGNGEFEITTRLNPSIMKPSTTVSEFYRIKESKCQSQRTTKAKS